MFDEEQEIINHEVESDDSIQVISEMPIEEPLPKEPENKQKFIEIIDEVQTEQKQPEKVQAESGEVEHQQDGGSTQQNIIQPNTNPTFTQDTQGCLSTQPTEPKGPSTFVSIFKKQSLKQLVRITSRMTDNEIDQIDQREKKLKQNPEIQVDDDDDVVIQEVNPKWSKNLHEKEEARKQKQWQLMASHFATQPDFIDAALAFTENHKKGAPAPVKPSILNKRGRPQGGQTKTVTIQDRPFEQLPANQPSFSDVVVTDSKKGTKGNPGKKKKGGKQVSFQESEAAPVAVSHRGIEYIKTSVTPEVQKVLQTEPQLIQQNQQPQQQSQQQFVPPYASSNQLNQAPNMENQQQLSHQQASQQSFQYKYLNMAQQLQVRTETSPKRVRDMITQQYMSSYQIEQPKSLPFRQQPIFQQQEMDRQIQYEINEKKRQEEKLKKKNPQQYAMDSKREKNERKLESKVKIQQITQAQQQSGEKQKSYDIIDSDDQLDIIEETSQDFIEFKQREDQIDYSDKEPLKPTFWKPIQGTEDIPLLYYFQTEYQPQQQQLNVDESKAQPMNLFRLFFNDHIIDLILKNNKELDCKVLDQFLAVQILQVLSQIQGNTEIYDSMKYEHLMENTLFTFWEDKLQLNQIVDNQMFLDQFNINLLKYYNPDELLILDKSIFDSEIQNKSTFILSDATKGYIFSIKDLDLTNYMTMNSQIITLLQPFTNQLNKVLLNEYINNPDLVNNLKQKSIGSLGRVQPIYSMLTNEQMENIDVRNNKPSYYLSHEDNILLLAMNLENLYLTSFNDLKKSIKNEKETEFIIIIMINNITKAQQKRSEMFTQLATRKKDYMNNQMNLFTTCLYSALWNASIIQRHLAKQSNQIEDQDKLTQKDWFISYTVQLMHQMTVLVYQNQQIQTIPNNHKLIYGQLNLCCQQCGKITKQLCQDCSNQFKKLIVVCTDDECYQYHILLKTYFQDKNQAEIIKTSEAIKILKQYKAKLLSEKSNETYKKAIETLDSTLDSLEIQDPDQLISQQLATMLQQLKSMIQLNTDNDDDENEDDDEDQDQFSQEQNEIQQSNEERKSQQSLNNRIEINQSQNDLKQISTKASNQTENSVQQANQQKETKPQLVKQKKIIGKLQVVKYSQQ